MNNAFSSRKEHRKWWSQNAVAKRERLRIQRAEIPLPDESQLVPEKIGKPKTATVSIRCGKESLTFQVVRWNEKKFLVRGKVKAASWIGKVVAIAIEGALS